MYNDTIKLLNFDQFNLKIKKLETTKIDTIIYCYVTLENELIHCPNVNDKIKITKKDKVKITN